MSWTKDTIPQKAGQELFGTQYFKRHLWKSKVVRTSPRKVYVRDLEYMTYCSECRDRYSPVCKYCELDGTCSFHGIDFENGSCPICSNTFQEDWDRYIIYRDKFERGLI